MSDNRDKFLKPTRKEALPKLVEKYSKLVDNIFNAVSKDLPDFKDIDDGDGEIIKTAEQQLFSFVRNRKDALATANEILNTINTLEQEQNDPEAFHKKNETDETVSEKQTIKHHPSKRHARNQ